MPEVFGMAGLAEAAMASSLAIGCGGVLLLGIVAAVGVFFRSRIAAVTALALAFLLSVLFTPWEAFLPVVSDDRDVHDWAHAFRMLGIFWIAGVVAAVAAMVMAFLGRSGVPAGAAKEEGNSVSVFSASPPAGPTPSGCRIEKEQNKTGISS